MRLPALFPSVVAGRVYFFVLKLYNELNGLECSPARFGAIRCRDTTWPTLDLLCCGHRSSQLRRCGR